jgi:hypothetical protein
MNTIEKVRLVETVEDQFDLSMALSAVHLPKSTWCYHQNQKQSYQEEYQHLHSKLEEIACEHPEYGILRITKELQDTYQIVSNHKVVQRLLRLWRLSLIRNIRVPKPSVSKKPSKQPENGRIWWQDRRTSVYLKWFTRISQSWCMQMAQKKRN